MAGIGDLLGQNGVIEQLLLWNVVGQVVTNLMSPAFTALQQDAMRSHPNMVITPDILARAVVGTFMDKASAELEAEKSGIDNSRFDILLKLQEVRLQPADLAEAVLRSYLTHAEGESQARLQGVTPDRFTTMTLLAGDGIGPQQAAEALRRKLIGKSGKGPDSTSYDQAIAESRLHNKWGPVLYDLTRSLLSPADAATAVVRGFLPLGQGRDVAALSGVGTDEFTTMVDLAADAPSPTDLSIALRRGIIPENSGSPDAPGFVQGIRQGRLADKWIPMIKALAQEWPTPTDALEARLVGQVTTEESQDLYERFGGDPKYWQLLFDTRGESPTPLELITMANRGYIPWDGLGAEKTTYAHGFHEGRWRNKWQEAYKDFSKYQPPEGTVTLFLSHGVITDEQASDMLAKLGMDANTIAMYLHEAHLESYSDYRGATITMVLQAYYQQLITAEQALPVLEGFHVTPQAAQFMLDFEDAQRAFAAVNNALTRLRTLFAARKITLTTARDSLGKLGVAPAAIEGVLKSWEIENSVTVKVLTEAQIADAMVANIMTVDQAMTELENIGYTPFDAWVILSIKVKAPLPNQPPLGPAPPQGQVIPGTT